METLRLAGDGAAGLCRAGFCLGHRFGGRTRGGWEGPRKQLPSEAFPCRRSTTNTSWTSTALSWRSTTTRSWRAASRAVSPSGSETSTKARWESCHPSLGWEASPSPFANAFTTLWAGKGPPETTASPQSPSRGETSLPSRNPC